MVYLTAEHVVDTLVSCTKCTRLREHSVTAAANAPARFKSHDYWARPVPGFGDSNAQLLIVGLAPAAHGGNRTGRAFTGDDSGNWLVRALWEHGLANQPTSEAAGDGLHLHGVYVTNALHCAPPDNKPLPTELATCRVFLQEEIARQSHLRTILTLGSISFQATLNALERWSPKLKPRPVFKHGLVLPMVKPVDYIVATYHPSRQNTNTGRLTRTMLSDVLYQAKCLSGL